MPPLPNAREVNKSLATEIKSSSMSFFISFSTYPFFSFFLHYYLHFILLKDYSCVILTMSLQSTPRQHKKQGFSEGKVARKDLLQIRQNQYNSISSSYEKYLKNTYPLRKRGILFEIIEIKYCLFFHWLLFDLSIKILPISTHSLSLFLGLNGLLLFSIVISE